mmetsp:Transcript_15532/g.27288  ORF Transcript_15532/g.27288 Transcript_15532/m.27288 type:complete len:221 (+) Transcript_15532:178-840(+)
MMMPCMTSKTESAILIWITLATMMNPKMTGMSMTTTRTKTKAIAMKKTTMAKKKMQRSTMKKMQWSVEWAVKASRTKMLALQKRMRMKSTEAHRDHPTRIVMMTMRPTKRRRATQMVMRSKKKKKSMMNTLMMKIRRPRKQRRDDERPKKRLLVSLQPFKRKGCRWRGKALLVWSPNAWLFPWDGLEEASPVRRLVPSRMRPLGTHRTVRSSRIVFSSRC